MLKQAAIMRIRSRKKYRPAALFCPVHRCLMPVRCVVGQRQYRYCPVDGCIQAVQTERTKLPRPRKLADPQNLVNKPGG
jgi:hypothetical protein